MLYDYFKQLFAQVTNPPIDSIREEVIMSLECYVGPEPNLLETTRRHAHRLRMPHPILDNEELAALKHLDHRGWRTTTIDITFPRDLSDRGMAGALDRICAEAEAAIDEGYSIVILSDRNMGADRVPISSLAACGAVHHHLVSRAKRTRIGIVLETGEAREVHHHCLLVGYGADAINPYLAFEALSDARAKGLLDPVKHPDDRAVVAAYRKGVAKGMLKVMAKMGISTLQSYKGAQIFEARGSRRRGHRAMLRRHREPAAGRGDGRARTGVAAAARAGISRQGARPAGGPAQPGRIPLAQPGRAPRLGSRCHFHVATGRAQPLRQRVRTVCRTGQRRSARQLHPAGTAEAEDGGGRSRHPARRGGACAGDRQALLHGGP